MSSKRGLYKPAPAAQTPPQKGRRSLSQGRLTSTDPRSLLANASPSVRNQSPNSGTTQGSRVRRSLNYNSAIMASRNNPNVLSHQISPTITRSPAKVKPSASLSLSEDEATETRKPEKEIPNPPSFEPSVLAVDASHRHASRVDNEVPIKTSYMKSPAKVVCHSPKRKTASEMTGSPHYGNAGKISIPVESVHSVTVSTALPHRNGSLSTCSPPSSEDGSLSTVAGSPVDPRSKAVETVVVQEKNNPRSYVSFLDDGSDVSVPCFDQSEVQVLQPRFDDTGISSSVGTSRLQDSGVEEVTRRKKKKTRVVQSKYMTSAMLRIGDKPPNVKRNENQSSRNTAPGRTSLLAKGKKTRTPGKCTKPVSKETGNESLVTNVKKPLFTSTPAEVLITTKDDSKSISVVQRAEGPAHPSVPTSSYLTPSKEQGRMKTTKDVHSSKDYSKPENPALIHPGKQTDAEISQLLLVLQHARVCQCRFLRRKARNAFKKQEKDAQASFYQMSQVIEQLTEGNHELRIKYAKNKKEEEVDSQLELQLSVLRNLDAQTRRFIPYYDKFCDGIDTTRHHMPLKNILVPNNDDEILVALNDFENDVGEISGLLQNDESKILSFSDEMQALAEIVETETEEQERCTELLAAANSLVTQEQSLQAELIERSEC